jgi:hypothetical protein
VSSYQVGDHTVDHPPFFACRKHKSFLKFNRSFVDELLAWAPNLQPQNLTEVAAASLDGDDQAFQLSEYLVPARVIIFNPRKLEGHGALPYVIALVDRKFFGIPASYLRRRIFEGCEECSKENDPASDASFADYRPPAPRVPPRPAGAPQRPLTKAVPAPGTGKPAAPRPAQTPQAKPGPQPTKSIPKRPGEPKFEAPPPPRDAH